MDRYNVAVFAEAYETKDGLFRGCAIDNQTKEVLKEVPRIDFFSAKLDAHRLATRLLGERPYVIGAYRNPKNSWKRNYFV